MLVLTTLVLLIEVLVTTQFITEKQNWLIFKKKVFSRWNKISLKRIQNKTY